MEPEAETPFRAACVRFLKRATDDSDSTDAALETLEREVVPLFRDAPEVERQWLRERLCAAVAANPARGSGWFFLMGKLFDPGLEPFFAAELERAMDDGNSGALHELVNALGGISDDIQVFFTQWSIGWTARDRMAAFRYLVRRQGRMAVPGTFRDAADQFADEIEDRWAGALLTYTDGVLPLLPCARERDVARLAKRLINLHRKAKGVEDAMNILDFMRHIDTPAISSYLAGIFPPGAIEPGRGQRW